MSGTLSIESSPAGGSSNLAVSPEKDDFSLDGCIKHIVRKAHYKSLGDGQLVKRGRYNFIRRNLEGNTADDRYHRAAYESSQRNTSAMLAETYRAKVTGAQGPAASLSNNKLLQSRFMRQDNVRFNPQLQDKHVFGLSKRNRWAVTFSRWAHHLNGVTELGAAPTGMLLKSSRIALTPNRDDRSGRAQIRVFAALGVIAVAVSAFSKGVFDSTIGKVSSGLVSAFSVEIRSTLAGYSAVSAVSAICSLICSSISASCFSQRELSPAIMNVLENNNDKHINRLHTLLNASKDSPDAVRLLTEALQPKIGKAYRDAGSEGKPVLLKRLLNDVQSANGDVKQAKQAMRDTLGSYLVEKDFTGEKTGVLLDRHASSRELLRRENHVVGLTNLIEHNRIHADAGSEYQDLRHKFEALVKNCREGTIGGTANLLNVLGFKGQSKKVAHMNTHEYMNARERRKKAPENAFSMRYSIDYMQDHPHQYGRITRSLLMTSEVIRTFNHNVPLSLNYQLTRPIAWLSGRFAEHFLKMPNSRTVSFSFGRAVASSFWAVAEAALIINPAAGNGIGFSNGWLKGATKRVMPIDIPFGGGNSVPLGATSTAAQMLVFTVLSGFFAIAASVSARSCDGWQGNIARPVDSRNNQRKSLQIGNLMPRES